MSIDTKKIKEIETQTEILINLTESIRDCSRTLITNSEELDSPSINNSVENTVKKLEDLVFSIDDLIESIRNTLQEISNS
jgi:hypothetical protein